MKVLVTGGTGFVGSHTVAALVAAGHAVRLLVRSHARLAPAMEPLGVSGVEAEEGDVRDLASVERALDGCDAVYHSAEVYSLDPRRADEIRRTNVRGTEHVLGTAHRLGLDPIVHVSSYVALLPASGKVLGPEDPPKQPPYTYPRAKADSERVARRLQDEGAPVVVLRLGTVLGPHDPRFGESHRVIYEVLTGRAPLWPRGGYPLDDVRDLACASAAAFRRGLGARSYLFGARYTPNSDLLALLSEVTGRALRTRLTSPRVLLPLARAGDAVRRVVPQPLYGAGTVFIAACEARCDDSRARAELGFAPRPLRETVADTVRSLVTAERLPPEKAGLVARGA